MQTIETLRGTQIWIKNEIKELKKNVEINFVRISDMKKLPMKF